MINQELLATEEAISKKRRSFLKIIVIAPTRIVKTTETINDAKSKFE
jgi:hypothetical protein